MGSVRYSYSRVRQTFGRAILGATILLAIGTTLHALTLTISPNPMYFGNQAIGTSTSLNVTLTNGTHGKIKIMSVSSSLSQFSHSGPPLPVTLQPGQSMSGTVTFTPTASQTFNGILTFTRANGFTITASLEGVGVQPVAAPSITTQPVSQTVTAGQKATFSVTANGTAPLTYQWQRNGAAISGATASSYTTPAEATSDSGAQFTVVVSNSAGTVTSNAAILTVNSPPAVITQPVNQTVAVGQPATLSVIATGTAPLSYQWRENGANISGATASTYTTPPTTASDNGAQFIVVVSNSVGTITSSVATLTVNVPPSITTQPTSQTVSVGQTATFSVTASGTAPLSYQWLKNAAAISGATSSSYTTPPTTSSDNGAQFTVVVSNSAGRVTSSTGTLTVNAAAPGALTPNTTSLNFNHVNVGSNSSLSVNFMNSGSSNITISNVTISGAGFTAVGISIGQIITPGQMVTMTVKFAPAATGSVTGSVTVISNASNSPVTISFSGTGVVVTHSATLTWTENATVAGYNVYRGSISGGPYTKINPSLDATTSFIDTTVQAGQTYYWVVTAVNSGNVESSYSNQIAATIPTP